MQLKMSTHQPIRFYHRGALVEIDDISPTRTVLEWLREDAHCTGTKEGCNEGDCGACTVVVGELATGSDDGAERGLALRAVNACMQFVPTLHGKALFTVEDLKPLNGGHLHPVQQAMVECHGSQCGFCTPGFVMSLWACYEGVMGSERSKPLLQPVQALRYLRANGGGVTSETSGVEETRDLTPPVRAEVSKPPVEHAQTVQSCSDPALRYQGVSVNGDAMCGASERPTRQALAHALSGNLCRCTGYRPILDAGERMFELPPVVLDTEPVIAALSEIAKGDATFCHGKFHAPATLSTLAALREAHPEARLLAGGTDIGVWVNKQLRELPELVYIGRVDELKRITEQDGELRIGAGASLEAAWRALAARIPSLTEMWLRFASPPIRHAGTLGGNVANGSPIGDAAPVWMALDAQLELRLGDRVRRLPLHEFYVDYMKNRLDRGEFVQAVVVPIQALQRTVRAYKISKRFDSDISAVCATFALELDGEVVREVRVAFGGMAAVVKRSLAVEAALLGQPWTAETVQAAQAALAHDFTPLTDMRASAAYRLQVAQNLLQRFWLETRAAHPLAPEDASVWGRVDMGEAAC